MKTYLDELFTRDDPTSEATRAEMKAKGPEWCQYCDFAGSLDDAFHLWDAVSPSPISIRVMNQTNNKISGLQRGQSGG